MDLSLCKTDSEGDTLKEHKGFLLVLIAIFLFSVIEVLTKLIGSTYPKITPMVLAFVRFGIGTLTIGIILSALRVSKNEPIPLKKIPENWRGLALFGILGITGTFLLFHESVALTHASSAAVIFSINPVFVAIISSLRGGKEIGRVAGISIITAIVGLALVGVSFIGFPEGGGIWEFVFGNFLMIFSALIWAVVYTLKGKGYVDELGIYGSSLTPLVGFGIGSFSFLALATVFEDLSILLGLSLRAWIYLILLGAVTTGIGHWVFFKGLKIMKKEEVPTGVTPFYIKPIIATVLSWIILQEKLVLQPIFIIGTILTITAIITAQIKK